MKKLIPLLFIGLIASLLPSCCGLGGGAQNGTGEPHIGTIPTMKILAE